MVWLSNNINPICELGKDDRKHFYNQGKTSITNFACHLIVRGKTIEDNVAEMWGRGGCPG